MYTFDISNLDHLIKRNSCMPDERQMGSIFCRKIQDPGKVNDRSELNNGIESLSQTLQPNVVDLSYFKLCILLD